MVYQGSGKAGYTFYHKVKILLVSYRDGYCRDNYREHVFSVLISLNLLNGLSFQCHLIRQEIEYLFSMICLSEKFEQYSVTVIILIHKSPSLLFCVVLIPSGSNSALPSQFFKQFECVKKGHSVSIPNVKNNYNTQIGKAFAIIYFILYSSIQAGRLHLSSNWTKKSV